MLLFGFAVLHPFLYYVLLASLWIHQPIYSKLVCSSFISLDILKLSQVEPTFPLKASPFLRGTLASSQLSQFILSFYLFSTIASLLSLIPISGKVQLLLLLFILLERFLTFCSPPALRPCPPYHRLQTGKRAKPTEPQIDERRLERAATLFVEKPEMSLPNLIDEMKATREVSLINEKEPKRDTLVVSPKY